VETLGRLTDVLCPTENNRYYYENKNGSVMIKYFSTLHGQVNQSISTITSIKRLWTRKTSLLTVTYDEILASSPCGESKNK
jgi:hypothetical protein